ncbi:MAG: polysaccharide deacetylase family protein [Polyangiaceae bacterium]|jgi:peptidoglycan/xylan/chitin deacetylase (PgdA/CDA1 family)|nr:polysaccharide deacetylase family protein [Polyangiaceae bacterium]
MIAFRPAPLALYAATAGGIGLAVRSVALHHPVPLSVALPYLGAYVALLAAGTAMPSLQLWGDALCSVPGGRGVALTFDDGPHPEHTPRVLEVLAAHQARATFFMIGEKVERHPEIVRQVAAAGHEIGSHAHYIDRKLALRGLPAIRADLEQSVRTLEAATGTRPTLFRPPYGVLNPRIFRVCDELSLDVIGWSARALDGVARTSAAEAAQRITRGLRDGAIACMHDAAEFDDRRPIIVDALPAIFEALARSQLAAVTVSELIASGPDAQGDESSPPAP